MAQDLQMIKEVERRRRENSLADEKESTKCNLYSEFRYKMQNKLKHLHEQVQIIFDALICGINKNKILASESRKKQDCSKHDQRGSKK